MTALPGRNQTEQGPSRLRGRARRTLVSAVIELVAGAVFAPAAIGILDLDEPRRRPAELGRSVVDASGVQRTQHRPSSVDIIHAPAAMPTSLLCLRATQIIERTCYRRAVRCGFVDLCQHRNTAGRDILGRRIEKSPMIGEGDGVGVVVLDMVM